MKRKPKINKIEIKIIERISMLERRFNRIERWCAMIFGGQRITEWYKKELENERPKF